MYTTTQLDNGITNNYAVEPEMSYSEYPGFYQQRNYVKQGALAALLLAAVLFISFAVS